MLERYNMNVYKELDCSMMNQSNMVNNVSAISFLNQPSDPAGMRQDKEDKDISFGIE